MLTKLLRNKKWLNLLGILALGTAILMVGWNAPRVLAQGGGGSEPENGQFPLRTGSDEGRRPPSLDSTSVWPSYWYTVIGADFMPHSSSITYSYGGMGCVSASSSGYWRASVNLPDKSVIKFIYFNYYNTTSATSSTVTITQYRYSGTYSDLATVTSRAGSATGAGYFFDLSSEITSPVNNLINGYAFTWSGSTTQLLCSVQVGYYPPSIFGVAFPFIAR